MWLSAELLLTVVLNFLEVFILSFYGPPSTGRIQQPAYNTDHKPQTGCHKKVLKLLNKYLLMVTRTTKSNSIYDSNFRMMA